MKTFMWQAMWWSVNAYNNENFGQNSLLRRAPGCEVTA